jgi:hypothetical protein
MAVDATSRQPISPLPQARGATERQRILHKKKAGQPEQDRTPLAGQVSGNVRIRKANGPASHQRGCLGHKLGMLPRALRDLSCPRSILCRPPRATRCVEDATGHRTSSHRNTRLPATNGEARLSPPGLKRVSRLTSVSSAVRTREGRAERAEQHVKRDLYLLYAA